MTSERRDVFLREVVGGGYDDFFKSQKRYVVVKGSRASKKSTSAALKIISYMMDEKYREANTLVIRQTAESLKDSCFAQLQWAIHRLGVDAWWKARVSPLELEYTPTKQKILFRGLDNPLKVTSITVKHGHICWAWLEEAYEVDEDAWEKIDQSLRGTMPDGYYIQWLITFNPWDSGSWLKSRFFDAPDDSVLAMTTTYKCNEWLSDADRALFERMRLRDPEQYKVAGLGEWGVAEGQFFKQWRSDLHVVEPFKIPDGWIKVRSMDWGSAAPYSCHWYAIDYDGNIWAYKELYGWGGKPNVGTGETAKQVAQKIIDMEDKGEVHHAILDCACWAKTGVTGPSIAEEMNNALHDANVSTFAPSSKGRAEMANAIKERLIGNEQEDGSYKPALFVFSNCIHLIRTLPMLAHDKSKPETYDTHGEDHCLIAGTMVCTRQGDKAIEEITTEDEVLTREGFKEVIASRLTNKAACVMTAAFSNGVTLTGTGNHPVYVIGKGFVRFDEMHAGDKVIVLQEVELCPENKQGQQTALSSMESHSDDTRYQTDWTAAGITDVMDGSESVESPICIKKCGSSIMAKFQKAITSIIKMATRLITPLKTWNCWKDMTTCQSTVKSDGKMLIQEPRELQTLMLSDRLQKSGTSQQKVMIGTSNMGSELLKSSQGDLKRLLSADNAENFSRFSLLLRGEQNSVQISAMQNIDAKAALMTRQESVPSAAKNFAATNTQRKRLVLTSAELKAWYWNEQPAAVYNLTVAEQHEYFANGVLVHNCVDDLGYMCLSRPWAPTAKRPAQKIDRWERRRKEKPRSAWTY